MTKAAVGAAYGIRGVGTPRVGNARILIRKLATLRVPFLGNVLTDEWRDFAREQGEHHDAEDRRSGEAALPRPPGPDDNQRRCECRDGENQVAGDEYFMINVSEGAVGAAAAREHTVHVESEAPGENEEDDAGEHGEMASHIAGDVQAAAVPAQARRKRVQEDDERRHDQERNERPVVQRLLERQPIHEEAEIIAEVRVRLVERDVRVRHGERGPVILGQTEDAAEEDRDDDDGEHQIPARHPLANLEVRHFARQVHRHDGIAHGVEIHKHEQTGGEPGEQAHNECRRRASAPELEGAGRLEPFVIDVDLGNGARREKQDRRAGNGQEHPSPLGRGHQPLVTRSRPATAAIPPSHPESPPAAGVRTPRTGPRAPAAYWRRGSVPSRRRTARVRRRRR